MKKQFLYYAFAIALTFGVYAGASRVAAQDGQITGGYGDAAVDSKETKKIARFAVKAWAKRTHKPLKLVKIVKAETQVVRGLNHRICMDVREGSKKAKRVTVVVWEDINNRPLQLTRWKTGKCQEL
ncbi:MAG TPA: cystatin domain-containing protein [Pyrinomonadaceae bacterium]|nr:cystatin domain-containing protein [Pyrinomonadaceae bacterium]